MKTNIIRWTLAAGFAVAAFAGTGSYTQPAQAEDTSHPDFAWWPIAQRSSRLFVGGLSGTFGSSDGTSFYYNPTELTLDKQAP